MTTFEDTIQLQRFIENLADIPYMKYYLKLETTPDFWQYYLDGEPVEDWSEGIEIETFNDEGVEG